MKKRTLSILFLAFYAVAMILSLVGCGGNKSVRGFYVSNTVNDRYYNEQTGSTSLNLSVSVTNDNSSQGIRSYKYKVVFRDVSGSVLATKIYSSYEALEAYDTENFYYYFNEDDGTAIKGNVAIVDVYPVEMTVSNEKSEGSSGESAWGFWAWFWTIVSGILVLLFITCCIGADGDSDAIIGGVVIFLAPAILILVIYFGFVFGSGL